MRTALSLLAALLIPSAAPAADLTQYWIYKSANLQVDKSADEVVELLKRGQQLGCTHMLLTDSKFSRLHSVIDRYFKNAARVRDTAKEAGITLVPAIFSIGYSDSLLSNDVNLVEGMQVRDVPMEMKGGKAALISSAPSLPGGDMSDLKKWSWKDENITAKDGAAYVKDAGDKNVRMVQKLKLEPWRQYHIKLRIKTRDFQGTPEVKILTDKGVGLSWDSLKVEPTQEWKEHHAVFHTTEHSQVSLYMGCWGAGSGELWMDDVVLEESVFMNLIRRPGAPLTIRTEDGKELKEGTDFTPLSDPQMGNTPWAGGYDVWHTPPALKTTLPDGTKLRVSCTHAVTVNDAQAGICPSEPKTLEVLRDHAKRVHELWHAPIYMMSHDEIRCWNQCPLCRGKNQTSGEILAENARQCVQIMKEVAPDARLFVWSDMFDPNHNAHDNYYLAHGTFAGAWEGLTKEVGIVPWYFEKRNESLKFFADRGHPQIIAGYYDAKPAQVPAQIKEWITAAKKVQGVEGVMYTTWRNNYKDLDAFMKAAKAAAAGK